MQLLVCLLRKWYILFVIVTLIPRNGNGFRGQHLLFCQGKTYAYLHGEKQYMSVLAEDSINTDKRKEEEMRKHSFALMLILAMVFACLAGCSSKASDPYAAACKNGYTGTKEEWVAAFVGEEIGQDRNEQSAFALACSKGYKESYNTWMKDTTGYAPTSDDQTAYELACANGYNGSLTEWLTSICPEADKLGISDDPKSKTDYEYACEYGFEGSFIEWLVSLVSDQNS